MTSRFFAAALLTTLLAGCTASEPLQSAGIATPSFWSQISGEDAVIEMGENAPIEHRWWKHFSDPTLDSLIADATENNKSLAIAKARVAEARAGRSFNQSSLFPQIDGTGSLSRANQGVLSGDKPITIAQANVDASWEIDLFGGNQARVRQSQALLESSEASRDAVMVSLFAELARNYFDLRNFEKQILITQQNLETQQKTLSLIKEQFKGALASDFDVQRANAQVLTTQAQLPQLRAAYDASLNRLQVLTGKMPGTLNLPAFSELKPLDEKILVAAPANVLQNRPDIRVAEREFAASISASDAAFREIFPKISLLGLFGVQDSSSISTHPWSAGVGLVMPILNFGRISSQIDAADAREQQAFLAYQQTVLEAVEDMENALSRYGNETARNQALNEAVASNRKAAELSRQQFTEGYNSLLDVLIVERNMLDSESALVASDAQLRKDLVAIYAAAGGGWDKTEPPVSDSDAVSPTKTDNVAQPEVLPKAVPAGTDTIKPNGLLIPDSRV